MWTSTDRDENNQTLEMRDSKLSYIETKNTNQKETTAEQSDRQSTKSAFSAAASLKQALKEEVNQKASKPHSVELTAFAGQKKHKSGATQSNTGKYKSSAHVDYIVNKDYKELIPLLDRVGIAINRTLTDLLKLYPKEKVESAIALLKERKRDRHIPNPSGYFVSALKGDWASKQIVENSESSTEVDTAAVFRHWYDLARELGYCSGQEVKEGEQWVRLSGTWEKWEDAANRGYSLDYLKKIMKRNQNQ